MRTAFAVGRLPWELEVDFEQFIYLQACDAHGLIPDPYDVGYRIGSCFTNVKRDEFMPRPNLTTREQREQTELARLTAGAGDIGEKVTFD